MREGKEGIVARFSPEATGDLEAMTRELGFVESEETVDYALSLLRECVRYRNRGYHLCAVEPDGSVVEEMVLPDPPYGGNRRVN